MILNTPSMPIKPSSIEIYDTSTEYSLERVSYGKRYSGISSDYSLLDGTSFEFEDNRLKNAT